MTKLDPDFGHWLAGFTDGEGCFYFGKRHNRPSYNISFSIQLTASDKNILLECKERTGVGYVRDVLRPPRPDRKTENPCVVWFMSSRNDIGIITEVFKTYPLRAQKAQDFAIWSRATDEWLTDNRLPILGEIKEEWDILKGKRK